MRLIILSCLFCSFISQANSKWDEQDFVAELTLASQQNDAKSLKDKLHQAQFDTSFVYLFDGISTSTSLSLSKQVFELDGLSDMDTESYGTELGLRYFINEFSNVDLILSHYNKYEIADPVKYRFYDDIPRTVNQNLSSFSWRFSLGNDQTLRKLTLSADVIDSKTKDGITDVRLREWQTVQAKLRFDHRFTEDSYWSADTEIRSGDYGSFESVSERTYLDVRAGFKTRYLGNSSISVLVGMSNQDQSDLLESNTVSWKIQNELNVTENLIINLGSIRQFNYSDNPNFSTSDQITTSLDINYSLTEQLGTTVTLQSVHNEYSEQDWSEDNSVLIRANYLYNDHLLIFFETELADLKGNQTELNFDNTSASLGIKFELL